MQVWRHNPWSMKDWRCNFMETYMSPLCKKLCKGIIVLWYSFFPSSLLATFSLFQISSRTENQEGEWAADSIVHLDGNFVHEIHSVPLWFLALNAPWSGPDFEAVEAIELLWRPFISKLPMAIAVVGTTICSALLLKKTASGRPLTQNR
jgi:hypothetical protein